MPGWLVDLNRSRWLSFRGTGQRLGTPPGLVDCPTLVPQRLESSLDELLGIELVLGDKEHKLSVRQPIIGQCAMLLLLWCGELAWSIYRYHLVCSNGIA